MNASRWQRSTGAPFNLAQISARLHLYKTSIAQQSLHWGSLVPAVFQQQPAAGD
jgi:hypothetical protein